MPQTRDMTLHHVTVGLYRHGADLSLCFPLMWNVTLEYTTTHFKEVNSIEYHSTNEELNNMKTHGEKEFLKSVIYNRSS